MTAEKSKPKPVAKPAPAAKKIVARKVAAKKSSTPKLAAGPSADKKPVKPPKVEKTKLKLVRDSFTMPSADWDLIRQLKERALGFKRPTKKSELLRAGLRALAGLTDAKLQAALNTLEPLKVGRPRSETPMSPAPKSEAPKAKG
jgi:hypothetical protein